MSGNTAEEVWALLREVVDMQKETDRKFQETDRKFQETDRMFQETDRELRETFQETDRRLRELGKQLGGLGEKFGSFTEGLALPSMQRILREEFGMEVVSPSVRVTRGGEEVEIDTLAYANSDINQAYLVEVKSHPREESITQMKRLLGKFRDFFPEHKDKTVFGILAAVDITPELRKRALAEGLYVARIHDGVFTMDTPENFRPKAW